MPVLLQWRALASSITIGPVQLLFCLDKEFSYPNKKYYMSFFDLEQAQFLRDECSPLTIVSFVVDYYHPTPTTGRVIEGSGGYHSSHKPPCTCSYPGACPWCHVR